MERFAIQYFNQHAEELARQYNAIDRRKVHHDLLAILPRDVRLNILDIGAGSGADAAMFAEMGHHVVAVEPAERLRRIGERHFAEYDICWTNEMLPQMGKLVERHKPYDVITSVGVFQYMEQEQRDESLHKMFSLLAPNGVCQIQYPTPASREGQFTVAQQEISLAVDAFNQDNASSPLHVLLDQQIPDFTGRKALDGSDLFFRTVILRRMM